ncbi:hypothetical protein [Paramicrobacterium chengjingii]|uniref:hypothetical protein n=1 Tax=Paramicrobacterium chengjingii TaxID=2769067 RepID=UPI0014239E54|nr:hypothetical protein [Microbacterium chengjingii]
MSLMPHVFDVVSYRDGNWWTFEIPGLTSTASEGRRIVAMGQARKASDVAREAKGVAALWLDLPDADDVDVNVEFRQNSQIA